MARHPDVIGSISKNIWLGTHQGAEEPPAAEGRKTDWYLTFYILIRPLLLQDHSSKAEEPDISNLHIGEFEASLGCIAGKPISRYLSQTPVFLLKEKWLHYVTCQSGIRQWGCPPISKSAQPHTTALMQNVPSNHNHRPCTTSLKMSFPTVTKQSDVTFLEDSGKFKCWTVLLQQISTVLTHSPKEHLPETLRTIPDTSSHLR